MTLQDEARELIAAATLWPWTDGTPAPELLAALCEQLDHAEAAAADWKATAEDREATIDEYREHAAAIADRAKKAEAALQRVRDLADWHETKATKARLYPAAEIEVMQKAAQVHDDAARRLRAILEGGE